MPSTSDPRVRTAWPVHATLANRDQIDGDDNVQLILTPFIHARQALVFAVNPFGIQEDGTITEGAIATGPSFGIASHAGPPPTDLSPDFVYDSKGRLTSWGYEVVVRIPFRSVDFSARIRRTGGSTSCAWSSTPDTRTPGIQRASPRLRSSSRPAPWLDSRASTAASRSISIHS